MPSLNRQKVLTKVFGDPQRRILKRLEKRVKDVNALEEKYKAMKKPELAKQTEILRKETRG